MKVRTFYTDGATSNNGYENSSGGFGVIELDEQNNICYEYQEFKAPTTNNEMELMAILHTLQYIQKESNNFIKPIIYTDSAYCYNIITNWMYSWEKIIGLDQKIKRLKILIL